MKTDILKNLFFTFIAVLCALFAIRLTIAATVIVNGQNAKWAFLNLSSTELIWLLAIGFGVFSFVFWILYYLSRISISIAILARLAVLQEAEENSDQG